MLYAILCYHDEDFVGSWTREQDAAVMQKLAVVQDKLTKQGRLGPVARLLVLLIELSALVVNGMLLAEKTTFPLGGGPDADTVAVNVTLAPDPAGLREDPSTVAVPKVVITPVVLVTKATA